MRNQIKKLLFAGLAGIAALSAHAQPYSNAVMALHPIAYYPLNETAAAPAPLSTLTITNYGTDPTLNLTATNDVIFGNSSPLASQPTDSSDSFNGINNYATTTYNANLANQPPFTIEGWFLSRNLTATQCPTSDFDSTGSAPFRSGWLLYMDFSNPGQYTFRTYNQNGTTPSASLDIGAPHSILSNQWYYLAVVVGVSGGTTNITGYLNGQPVAGPIALTSYVPNDGLNGSFTAGIRSDTGFPFNGNIDELAYYTNALSAGAILSHYQAATNPSPATAYDQLVLQQNPLLYYRFNEAKPALSSSYPEPLPVAANYGSLGASAKGFYTAGSNPGAVSGPTNAGIGGFQALELNPTATESTTTAGPGVWCAPFNPLQFNLTTSISVAFWAQVTSATTYFETVMGRSDQSWRFDVDPNGLPHWAAAPNGDLVGGTSIADGQWHYWAGVYDPVAGVGTLYIDSVAVASAGWGNLSSEIRYPTLIGGAPDYVNGARNFSGNLAQVAIFNSALSPAQVSSLYDAAGGTPVVGTLYPTITVSEGGNTNIVASGGGSTPLSFQWYATDTSANTTPIPGATNLTLNFTNTSLSLSGFSYYIVASNALGTATSGTVTLSVVSGPPTIQVDVSPLSATLPVGVTDGFSITATGSQPITYQWYSNSVAITNATNTSYSFKVLNGTNDYYVIATNSYGSAMSSTATVIGYVGVPPVVTFGDGTDWATNSNAGSLSPWGVFTGPDNLLLTDGTGTEIADDFYIIPQYIDGFVASFTYLVTNNTDASALADGVAFMVQNTPDGTNALGGGGGELGYTGIANSVAFEINIYAGSPGGVGVSFGTDGSTPGTVPAAPPYTPTTPVSLTSTDPINVRVVVVNGVMYAKLTDATTGATFSASHTYGDLASIIGTASGYVGFSGATGGSYSTQAISNFHFTSTTSPVLSLTVSNTTALVTWPVSVSPLFQLQSSSSVTGPYTTLTNQPAIVGGSNEVALPKSGAAEYFRLILP